jgi:hypothetical protein
VTRLEKWIETRITGHQAKMGISTRDLIAEASGLMDITLTPQNVEHLKEIIAKTRDRIRKRKKRRKKISAKLARELFVSPKLVMRWIEIDLLNPKRIREVERWKKIIIEREYYRQVMEGTAAEENIPMGKKQNLWD